VSPGLSYVVIRCHAMRAELIDPETLKSLAEAGDMKEFLGLLSQTRYKEIIEEAGEGVSAVALERAFYQKLIERLDRVVRVAPKGMAEFLRAYYHMRLEVQNLKRILRGKSSETSTDRIKRHLIPVSPYLSVDFEDLVGAETMADSVNLLGKTVYASIKKSLALCEKYDALWPIEAWLNQIYVGSVQESLSKISSEDRVMVRQIVEVETDVENLLSAINWRRMAREQPSLPRLESIFPLTYGTSLRTIKGLIEGRDPGDVVRGLGAPYAEILEPIIDDDVALVRTNLRRHGYEAARGGRARDDFGFPCVMSYLISCEAERGDLVSIAWGKEHELEPKRILKYTVLPEYAA
jgi:vacuolar-type H+-ATPase subunit C/Vma6